MIQLDIPRLPRRMLRCPLCGKVHRFPVRMMVALLVTSLILALLTVPQVRILLATPEVGRSDLSENTLYALEIISYHLQRSEDQGTDAPRMAHPGGAGKPPQTITADDFVEEASISTALDVNPTPIPIPTTAVVWNRTGSGTYLWNDPGGDMVTFIDNGLVLTLTEQWQGFGGVPYGEVVFGSLRGWVDMRAAHRVDLPEDGFSRLGEGRNLYEKPGGPVLGWLPAGTPVVEITLEGKWIKVSLLIGQDTGWIYHPQPSQ